MNLEQLLTFIPIITAIVGIITLIKLLKEYNLQGKQKRIDLFINMRKRLKENNTFKEIANMIEHNSPKLEKLEFKDKRDYLGFFEEILIMVNSGLIRKHIATYMFGYYALRCWKNENFWIDVNRESRYWIAFRKFVKLTEENEKSYNYKEKNYQI